LSRADFFLKHGLALRDENLIVDNFNGDGDEAFACTRSTGAKSIVEIEERAMGGAADLILCAGE